MSHIAELFPAMPDDQLRALADDIMARGLLDPIITFNGHIIDGRHRYMACQMAGVEPRFATFEGTEADALGCAVSHNVHRRNMGPAQRAMVAGRLANLRNGQRADLAASMDAASVTQGQAAKLLNVSRPSVQRAREVLAHGNPELIAAVDRGEMSVRKAATTARATSATSQEASPDRSAGAKKAKPERHAVHRKMHYRKPNREVDRAISALDGICIGLDRIDLADLDPSRCAEWSADFKKIASTISAFSRSLANGTQHSTQSLKVRHGSRLGPDDRSCGAAEAVNDMGQQAH